MQIIDTRELCLRRLFLHLHLRLAGERLLPRLYQHPLISTFLYFGLEVGV